MDVPTAPLEYISEDQNHVPNRQEKSVVAGSDPPYKLYCFPSSLRNGDKRRKMDCCLTKDKQG